jgi:hypothetical protein
MVFCPCCGHAALTEADGGFCAVCAWDDRDPDGGWRGKPRRGLVEAQRQFVSSGVSDLSLAELVRPARPDEAPPPWWLPFDAERPHVRALLADAYRDTRLDGGTTLDEAELIDDYASPARTERDRPPPGYREPPPWQELTAAGLGRFAWGNFSFHDARGLRYYTPAYTCAYLDGCTHGALESLLYTLESGHQLAALLALLSPAQRHANARFLAHLATADGYFSSSAANAIREPWGAHLDPAHRAHVLR